ncbi:hypothetical protein CFIMG_003139RA [Ceratocystis fimbriata CBS 114723]|uniref:Uncharacterized protein n=1 Tax=Ceratocystis fimbriata CBS 114723 TaxID=1035309 RepID=A0A2C5WXJ4_9PEZI|nr:hypothetical protein CFIMG_003139RA [Ceratocystis fimbriata CBS 114723]
MARGARRAEKALKTGCDERMRPLLARRTEEDSMVKGVLQGEDGGREYKGSAEDCARDGKRLKSNQDQAKKSKTRSQVKVSC